MTHHLRSRCVFLIVATCLCGTTGLKAASTTQPVTVTPAPEPLPPGLQKRVDFETSQGATLGAVIAELREITGANIVANWNALQQYGITSDNPISLPKVTAVPASQVLDLVLQQVSATLGGVTRLAWVYRDDVITITTRDELSQDMELRIYDVSELANLLATVDPAGGKLATPAEQVARIESMTMETVQRTSWRKAGGEAGLRALGGQLVVTHTVLAHEEIAQLLQRLRESAIKANPLLRPIRANFASLPLADALERLTQQADVNLYVNWDDLKTAGVASDAYVRLQGKDIPLRQALQLALDSAAAGTSARLGLRYDNGVVIIATEQHLAEALAPKSEEQKAQETAAQIGLVDRMTSTYSDPIAAGVVAIGAIRGELQRTGQDVIAKLESLLNQTRSQGLRNALHMTLKDLYQQAGKQEKVMEHLTRMLEENDAANIFGGKAGLSEVPQPSRAGERGEDPTRGRGDSRGNPR